MKCTQHIRDLCNALTSRLDYFQRDTKQRKCLKKEPMIYKCIILWRWLKIKNNIMKSSWEISCNTQFSMLNENLILHILETLYITTLCIRYMYILICIKIISFISSVIYHIRPSTIFHNDALLRANMPL